jgi:hypothetical protein
VPGSNCAAQQAPANQHYKEMEPGGPVVILEEPYAGLRAMTKSDAGRFFGREAERSDLVAKLEGSRLVAVVADSGSGKSSLTLAGLIPQFCAPWQGPRPGRPLPDQAGSGRGRPKVLPPLRPAARQCLGWQGSRSGPGGVKSSGIADATEAFGGKLLVHSVVNRFAHADAIQGYPSAALSWRFWA